GHRVLVLEARAHPGGRVRTVRTPFDGALSGELGAARIADTHYIVRHWANAFNLPLVPFAPQEGATLMVLEGRRARLDAIVAGDAFIPDVHDYERGVAPGTLFNR